MNKNTIPFYFKYTKIMNKEKIKKELEDKQKNIDNKQKII